MNGPGRLQTDFGDLYRCSGQGVEGSGLLLQVKSDGYFVIVCEQPNLLSDAIC